MSRRSAARRNIKRRGVVPSFGDMILPVVGFAAVILLVLAGRQFFLNGLKTSPGISSTRAYAEAPALIAERENKSESDVLLPSVSEITENVQSSDNETDELLSNSNVTENEFLAIAVATQAPAPQVNSTMKLQPVKSQTPAKAKTSTANSSNSSKSSASTAKSSSSSSSMSSMMQQWRVQIGAYTSKAGAQEAANKIKKSGYKAIVYQNPASKHFKVWVEGGATKKSAERVVTAMQKIGYKGSFAFPPAK